MPAWYALGLGSNRRHGRHGPPRAVIHAALATLAAEGVAIRAISRIIETPPVGPSARRFANAVAVVESDLAPPALLALAKRIERDFGRRRGRRWGARVIDIDLLLWSGGAWTSRGLTLPHPAMPARRFVLDPLVEVAGTRAIRAMRARLRKGRAAGPLTCPATRHRSGGVGS